MIIGREKHGAGRETCPSVTLYTTGPLRISLGLNLGIHGEQSQPELRHGQPSSISGISNTTTTVFVIKTVRIVVCASD
jgi:hypothetical protein